MDLYFCRGILIIFMLAMAIDAFAQATDENAGTLPKEVRGYKIHRAQVELKKTKEPDKKKSDKKSGKTNGEPQEYDETEPLLIRLGDARLVSVTPLGVTLMCL